MTEPKLEDLKMPELRKIAKDEGVNSFGKKKEDIIAEIKEKDSLENVVEVKPQTRERPREEYENFVTRDQVEEFKARGYKVSELNSNSGFSLDKRIRPQFIEDVKKGLIVYMVK